MLRSNAAVGLVWLKAHSIFQGAHLRIGPTARRAVLTVPPPPQIYLHLTGGWHPDLNNEAYVRPETYAEVLQDSIFAPCPKVCLSCVGP